MELQTYRRRREGTALAVRWEGGREQAIEICKWIGAGSAYIPPTAEDPREYIRVTTVIGNKLLHTGHSVVRTGEGDYMPYRPEAFEAEYVLVDDGESELVRHARVELSKFPNEDPDFIESIMNTVKAFAHYRGHSGSSADIAVKMVTMLICGWNLLPLTDDPEEWELRAGADYGIEIDMWQNKRNSKAMSEDGGKTYWLVGTESKDDGSRIFMESESKDFVPEIDEDDLKSDEELWAEKFEPPYCSVPGHPEGNIMLDKGEFYCSGCESSQAGTPKEA